MSGIIITVEKEELEEIIGKAVEDAIEKTKNSEKEQKTSDSEILQMEQLCEYLKIKSTAVYQLTTYKKIPYFKKGRRLFFKKDEIDEWLHNGRKAIVHPAEEEDRLTKAGNSRK